MSGGQGRNPVDYVGVGRSCNFTGAPAATNGGTLPSPPADSGHDATSCALKFIRRFARVGHTSQRSNVQTAKIACHLSGCGCDSRPQRCLYRQQLAHDPAGFATTGFATTGFATTGLATTGLATTGLATTGLATTGLATTGFATTGFATTGFGLRRSGVGN